MIKIKMKSKDGVKEFNASQVLAHINATEELVVLKGIEWGKDGTKDFLMGKASAIVAIIDEPLSEEDAEQGVKEYRQLLGI